LQNIRGSDSLMDSRSQNPIIPQLLVLLTKIRGTLIIALGIERMEKDEDKQTLHANYRAKTEMRYLMQRGIFPSQYSALVIRRNFQAEVNICIEVEKGVHFRKLIDALTYNGQTGRKAASAIDVKRYLGRTILPANNIMLRQAKVPRQVFITGSDIFRSS
jgi:hypothetical protein